MNSTEKKKSTQKHKVDNTAIKINNSFSTLAHWGILTSNLTDSDIVLFLVIQTRYQFFNHSNLDYFESQEVLAEHLGWSLSKVKRSIKNLKDSGYITVTKIDMRRLKYVVNNPYNNKKQQVELKDNTLDDTDFEILF